MKYPNSETSMSNVYMKKPFMYKHQFNDREITAVDLSIGKCNNTLPLNQKLFPSQWPKYLLVMCIQLTIRQASVSRSLK
jgi:hypothetical protein